LPPLAPTAIPPAAAVNPLPANRYLESLTQPLANASLVTQDLVESWGAPDGFAARLSDDPTSADAAQLLRETLRAQGAITAATVVAQQPVAAPELQALRADLLRALDITRAAVEKTAAVVRQPDLTAIDDTTVADVDQALRGADEALLRARDDLDAAKALAGLP
jgi:hypothetical protein